MADAEMVPGNGQTHVLREQCPKPLRLCSGQSRPSFLSSAQSSQYSRGRRGRAKSGASV
jgi:hypothetical protein